MLRNPWFHASQKRIKIDFLKYYILRKLKKLFYAFLKCMKLRPTL